MLQTTSRRVVTQERQLARRLLTLLPRLAALCGPALRARHLTIERLKALHALERQPRRSGELAELWGLTPGAVSLLVDGLVADGLVARREDARDRRAVLLELTPSGRRELRAAEDVAVAALAEPMRALGPAGIVRLSAALADLEQALAKRSEQ